MVRQAFEPLQQLDSMSSLGHELLRKLLAQVDRGGRRTLPVTPRYARSYFEDGSLAGRETIHAVLRNAEQAGGVVLEWGTGAACQDLKRLRLLDADKLAAWLRATEDNQGFSPDALGQLERLATEDTAAGVLARSWCQNPRLGPLEQEWQDPLPPG